MSEESRLQDLKNRIAALYDERVAHFKLNPSKPNYLLFQNVDILENSNHEEAEANMIALEEADLEGKSEREAVIYKEQRSKDYPSIEDQLDKIYHEGLDAWKEDILLIKNKYPKPE